MAMAPRLLSTFASPVTLGIRSVPWKSIFVEPLRCSYFTAGVVRLTTFSPYTGEDWACANVDAPRHTRTAIKTVELFTFVLLEELQFCGHSIGFGEWEYCPLKDVWCECWAFRNRTGAAIRLAFGDFPI